MNWLLPLGEHLETEHEVLSETVQEPQIPALPMEWWPSCFWYPRKSADGKYYEVMLNETAWSEAWKIWKFHPPKQSAAVLELTEELKRLQPFVSDSDLTGDLDLLCDYAANKWIIEDTFTNHLIDRFGFRDSHHDFWKYSKKHSRIWRNILNPIVMAIPMINQGVGLDIKTRLNTLWNRINSEKYDDKTFAEKIAFTEETDQDILQFLRAIHSHLNNPTLQ